MGIKCLSRYCNEKPLSRLSHKKKRVNLSSQKSGMHTSVRDREVCFLLTSPANISTWYQESNILYIFVADQILIIASCMGKNWD